MPKILYCLTACGSMPLTHCTAFDNTLLRYVKIITRRTNAELDRIAYDGTGIMPFGSLALVRDTKALLNIIDNNKLQFYLYAKTLNDASAYSKLQCDGYNIKLEDFKRTSDRYCFAYNKASNLNKLSSNLTTPIGLNKFHLS